MPTPTKTNTKTKAIPPKQKPAHICTHCHTHIIYASEVSREYCSDSCASADGYFTGRD
jgi:hypothetical protein